jgi:hypothetical protein
MQTRIDTIQSQLPQNQGPATDELSKSCGYIVKFEHDKHRLEDALASQNKENDDLRAQVNDLTEDLRTQTNVADVAVSRAPKSELGGLISIKGANRALRLQIQSLKDTIDAWKVLGEDGNTVAAQLENLKASRALPVADSEVMDRQRTMIVELQESGKETQSQVEEFTKMLGEATET